MSGGWGMMLGDSEWVSGGWGMMLGEWRVGYDVG